MADPPEAERRIYVLPPDLLSRLRAYQTAEKIPSEVEAVRRLLDTALQMRDSVESILEMLKARQTDELDLKVLAKEVVSHALVDAVEVRNGILLFRLSTGDAGSIDRRGAMRAGVNEHDMRAYIPAQKRTALKLPQSGPSWDSPDGGNLDDEIPF